MHPPRQSIDFTHIRACLIMVTASLHVSLEFNPTSDYVLISRVNIEMEFFIFLNKYGGDIENKSNRNISGIINFY